MTLPPRVFPVPRWLDGVRLDHFLSAVVPRLSRSKAARICRTSVEIDPPRRIRPSLKVRHGDVVRLARLDLDVGAVPAATVVFRGPRIAALEKPPGLLVHPTASITSATLTAQMASGALGPDLVGAEPAHRLDRETSGLVLAGLDPEAIKLLRTAFRDGAVSKTYLAVVDDREHRWQRGQREALTTPLGFDAKSSVKIKMGRGTLEARTEVAVLDRIEGSALLQCRIATGRQHQIRVHLALEGTPILGDKLYGGGEALFLALLDRPSDPELRAKLSWPRHALHASRLVWSLDGLGDGTAQSATPDDFPLWPRRLPNPKP